MDYFFESFRCYLAEQNKKKIIVRYKLVHVIPIYVYIIKLFYFNGELKKFSALDSIKIFLF